MTQKQIIYVHGKGGSAAEADHYRPLFPSCDVTGFEYRSETPQEAEAEFGAFFASVYAQSGPVILIANSIGAYFAMCAGVGRWVERAYFISPVVDMEKLIVRMMRCAGVTQDDLREKGVVHTDFDEDLSWDYLSYVRSHPIEWRPPTEILYGGADALVPREDVEDFARHHGAHLTVMEDGEHWFHTESQMRFLDRWISESFC